MGIDIQIRIDLSPLQKRILRSAIVGGGVVAALGIGLAIAAPHQWNTNDPLKAADLNGLNVISYTTDAGTLTYSVGATKYCADSPTTTNGAISYAGFTGYAAAKKMCETATGCSATAHMCTGEEVVRSAALTVAGSGLYGWYAGSYRSEDGTTGTGHPIVDCSGYTYSGSNNGGPIAQSPVWNPTYDSCDQLHHVLCCD